MTDTYVRQIWNDSVDAQDIICLQKAVGACYTGHKVEDVLRGLAGGEVQLWRGESPRGRFAIITKVMQYPGGRQLEFWSIGGEGYMVAVPEVDKVLRAFAKEMDCKWIAYTVERGRAFERKLKDVSHKFYTLMVQEV